MLRIKFVHTPKPKQFKYNPRYYDPEKEEFEKRKAELRKQKGYDTGSSIRGAFTNRSLARRKAQRSSNIRLLIILAVLLIIGWWLLQ
ncbi:MAG: hypothetical protein ACOX0M_08475 [Salinivirgaceae bacterium]|jgi:hypothetical protein|nr:hypothetical protein [Bacteroidales bacterium]